MAEPAFTKAFLSNLLYPARGKSEEIYVALGDGRSVADLKPVVKPGNNKQKLFMYFLDAITRDGVTTKDKLVAALRADSVREGDLAKKMEETQTIKKGSVLEPQHLQYLIQLLRGTVDKVTDLAQQLQVNLGPGTVDQDDSFTIMLKEITENKVVTAAELATALRNDNVREGHLAAEVEKVFGIVPVVKPEAKNDAKEGGDTQSSIPPQENPISPTPEIPLIEADRENIVCTEAVTLTCKVSAPPSDVIAYQWIKDGKEVKKINGYTGLNRPELKIISFSLRKGGHNGEYICRVTIKGNIKVDSHPFQLQGFKSMKYIELKERATEGKLTLNLGSILEKYHLHNYQNLDLESKPAIVECVVNESIVNEISELVMNEGPLYLKNADVCDQKTEVLRHRVTSQMLGNESDTKMHSTIGQTVNIAKQHGTSVVDNKSTTFGAAFKPEVKADGVGVALGELSVAHTTGTTMTKADEETDGREQRFGVSHDLSAHDATISTVTDATEKHSCILKEIPVSVATLKLYKKAMKYSIAYTKVGSDKKIPLEKEKSQNKQIGHFLTKEVTGGRDKILIDFTYTWDVPLLQNTQS